MISKPFESIASEDIQALIDNEAGESRVLEYKQSLPGNSDDDKKEFLADISAFANASGGDLVYGVSEKKNEQGQNTGLPDKIVGIGSINQDAEWRRLEDILRTSIQPRLMGVQKKFVDCNSGLSVLVIRLPKSWQRPHMVTFKNLSRFYCRTSAGKYQMDVSELRHAFLNSGSVAERLRLFIGERVSSIAGGETRLSMPATPKIALFVLPIGAVDQTSSVDIKVIGEGINDIITLNDSVHRRIYNMEGVVCFTEIDCNCDAYVQIYRNGTIESVESSYLSYRNDGLIPIFVCEEMILKTTKRYIELLSRWGVAFPYYVVLSLIGVKGLSLNLSSRIFIEQPQKIVKDMLLMPEAIIESSEASIDKLMRPSFDMIWQACGKRECASYDKDGNWVGSNRP
ncbi:MAG: ATP-binding protein [Kiritimatiellae bacterium]|nr:ATP-binding protein [Kiritimatiellia bacterium]MDD5519491.1 ATP-binding protein [Kiritimatiellia bacterium]